MNRKATIRKSRTVRADKRKPVRSSEPVRRRPATWEKFTGIKIYDPDGWRTDGQSFYKPVTRVEWNRRQMMSTCVYVKLPN